MGLKRSYKVQNVKIVLYISIALKLVLMKSSRIVCKAMCEI